MTRSLLLGAALAAIAVAFRAAPARAATPLVLSAADREAITRVALAEAGNQGDSGIAAVVQTILNRTAAGGWGSGVEAVVDAPHQFEPVSRAGGDWRRLAPGSEAQRARVDTILSLIADGRMPDFIGGALYFQNPRIVASRVAAGTAPASRLNFGGMTPVVTIGAHAFYTAGPSASVRPTTAVESPIFVPKPASDAAAAGAGPSAPAAPAVEAPASPERAMFILSDGRLAEDPQCRPNGR